MELGDAAQEIEFSSKIRVDQIGDGGKFYAFEADDAERRTLAQRFDLVSLESLCAEVEAVARARVKGRGENTSGIRLRVHLKADVVQSCVVTLEPVSSKVDHRFEIDFLPLGPGPEAAGTPDSDQHGGRVDGGDVVSEPQVEVVVDVDEVDPPEYFHGGEIEVGEAIAENLALALDPYPRATGAEVDTDLMAEATDDDGKTRPFAVLEKLIDRQ